MREDIFHSDSGNEKTQEPRKSKGGDSQQQFVGMGIGGEIGIRTLGTIARTTVFETAPFDRSGTSPWGCVINVLTQIRKR
mgnify:CR=1 FL=1